MPASVPRRRRRFRAEVQMWEPLYHTDSDRTSSPPATGSRRYPSDSDAESDSSLKSTATSAYRPDGLLPDPPKLEIPALNPQGPAVSLTHFDGADEAERRSPGRFVVDHGPRRRSRTAGFSQNLMVPAMPATNILLVNNADHESSARTDGLMIRTGRGSAGRRTDLGVGGGVGGRPEVPSRSSEALLSRVREEQGEGFPLQALKEESMGEQEMVHASRVAALAESLSQRLMDGGSIERRELSSQLLSLSRFIDHAVASNQRPKSQQTILRNFKQFAFFKYDELLRPSIMVLMLSIKSACLAGWFAASDAEELLATFKVLFDYFLLNGECWKPPPQAPVLGGPVRNELADPESFILGICSRYFPRLMLISLNVALTVKVDLLTPCQPGYEVQGCDFQVTSQLAPSTKLRLFICQMDDTGTSACLVTPPLLSFLVNGKGVERRVYLATAPEAGPQLPTDITAMLRIGCNFLQVIGDSAANYFVAIAVMGSMPWSASSGKLSEYVVPSPSAEADDEVIVGLSRVSLRCPISHQRITTPAKGVSCRHHQAFDYDSYMEINDRRPSWRCPCCNTYVSCEELRLDRQMEQVLKEVDENIFDVMINQDGSWAPDVPADEMDGAHGQGIGQSPGENVMGRLDEGVIDVSDDEDDEQVERLVSPTEPFLARVSTVGTTTIDLADVVDRKPDIGSMYISDSVVGSDLTHAPVPVDASNRGALESPVLHAIYSPIYESQDQAGPAVVTNVTSIQDSHETLRNTTQGPVGNLSSWSPANNLFNSSSLPTGGLSSESRLLPMDSQLYPQQPGRSTVIQALPAPTHYQNPVDRGRISPSAHIGNTSVGQAISATGSASIMPTRASEAQRLQEQEMQNSDIADMVMMQELRQQAYDMNFSQLQQQHMDAAQHSQVQGQRAQQQQGVVQNGLGNVRDARTQHFAGGSSHQAGQEQQHSNHVGQQHQYPMNAPQQAPTAASRLVQEYWHRQRLHQLLQYATPRGSPGVGVPSANGGFMPLAPGAESGGSPVVSVSRIGSHSVNSGGSNSVANPNVTDGWVPPPQITDWRPAGTPRMRGAVGSGSIAGLGVGVRGGVLPGPVNSMRAPPNLSNMVPATMPQLTSISMTSRGVPAVGETGSGEMYGPESLSTPPLLPDVCWPPTTLLETSQVENGAPHDAGYWIDDALFGPTLPPDQ